MNRENTGEKCSNGHQQLATSSSPYGTILIPNDFFFISRVKCGKYCSVYQCNFLNVNKFILGEDSKHRTSTNFSGSRYIILERKFSVRQICLSDQDVSNKNTQSGKHFRQKGTFVVSISQINFEPTGYNTKYFDRYLCILSLRSCLGNCFVAVISELTNCIECEVLSRQKSLDVPLK